MSLKLLSIPLRPILGETVSTENIAMNIKQFTVLVVGLTLALLIIRYEPIRGGNPFYNPAQTNIARYLGKEGYRPPAVSRELNWSAAGIVLIGMVVAMLILHTSTAPVRRHSTAPVGPA
jgi:hypothetical protein